MASVLATMSQVAPNISLGCAMTSWTLVHRGEGALQCHPTSLRGLGSSFSVFPGLSGLTLTMTSESGPTPLPGLLPSELLVSWLY